MATPLPELVKVRKAINEVKKNMDKHEKIDKVRKKRGMFECLVNNFKLGFSNWPEVESFEKENKFIKKLRQSIYKEGVSQLIFLDLTKNEKSNITTKMLLENSEIGQLIDLKRLSEQM